MAFYLPCTIARLVFQSQSSLLSSGHKCSGKLVPVTEKTILRDIAQPRSTNNLVREVFMADRLPVILVI